MGVLAGGLRTATVITSPVVARVIGASELRGFLSRAALVVYGVACWLADRLAWANRRRVDFAAADAASRVGRELVALAQSYESDKANGRDLGASLTQLEIASLAGVRLATAEKTLRRLVQMGLMRTGYPGSRCWIWPLCGDGRIRPTGDHGHFRTSTEWRRL